MKAQRIKDLLNALTIFKHRVTGNWVQASCPFAKWTHEKGTDSNPSWGVSVHLEKSSWHQCMTCGEKGTLGDLVWALRHKRQKYPELFAGVDWKTALEIAEEDEEDALIADWDDGESQLGKHDGPIIFPTTYLESFPDGSKHPYLVERGIPVEVAKELEVKFDFQKQRVCFPIRNRLNQMVGMQGRDVTGASDLRYLTYKYNNRTNPEFWMGEDKVSWDDPLILTEGPLDYAKGYIVTHQMLASMTSSLGFPKLARLVDAPMLVTFYDVGTGGNHARADLTKWANKKGKTITHFIPPEEYGDLGAMPVDLIAEWLAPFL